MPHNPSPLFVRFPPILKYLLYAIPVWLVLSILVSLKQCVHNLANPSAAAHAPPSASATAQEEPTGDEYYVCDGRKSQYPPSVHARSDYQWHFRLPPKKSKTITIAQGYRAVIEYPEPPDLVVEYQFPLSRKTLIKRKVAGEEETVQLLSDRLFHIKNKEERTTISVVVSFTSS